MSKRILFTAVAADRKFGKTSVKIYEMADIFYLSAYLKSLGHETMVYDKDISEVDFQELDAFSPDIVCLNVESGKIFTEWIEKRKPGIIACQGAGTFSPAYCKLCLESNPELDLILSGGNVEPAWVKLLECLNTGAGLEDIKGLAYRKGGKVVYNPGMYEFDINDLKVPDHKPDMAYVITSRGCVGNCSFCDSRSVYPKWIGRSVKSVADELEALVGQGIRKIRFADRTFGSPNCKRISVLCQAIIDRQIPILYGGNFRPDFSRFATPEVMRLLAQSGLYKAYIGLEAGNQADLDLYHKRCTVEESIKTVRLFESYGIHVEYGFINFNSLTTLDKLRQNIDFLEELGLTNFEALKTQYLPMMGSRLTKTIEDAGLYSKEKGSSYQNESVKEVLLIVQAYFAVLEQENGPKAKFETAAAWRNMYHCSVNSFGRNKMYQHYNAVYEYLKRTEPAIKCIGILLSTWFRKLLDLAEQGFDQDKAFNICISSLSPDYISVFSDFLEKERQKLKNTLKEIDKGQVA